MARRAAVLLLVAIGAAGAMPAAQTTTAPAAVPDRPGPYVIDLRGATAGAPQAPAFYPPVPTGTIVPSRVFGFDLGGHVYLFQLGPARVGVGADMFRFRGTASPPAPKSTSGSSSTSAGGLPTTPDMTANITTIAPQVSLNFGSSTGWSYLSAGLGQGQVTTGRSSFAAGQAQSRKSGSVTSQNFGGGARWFTSDHLAFTFDVRFHLLSPGAAQTLATGALLPGTPRRRIVSASAGISLR